jgi:UDP-glucuronate decarboxylase
LTGAIHESRVVVTGGAGFLGSHLCERLLSDGHVVIAVDNFYTGSRNNIAHLTQNPRFSVVEHDVTAPLDIEGEVEQIFNLACPASPPHYQRDPIKTTMTSVLGVYNMLELARKTGAKILQASTSEVYGDPTIHPQPESYWGNVNPIGIRSCYDEGKRVAETFLFDFHRQYGVPIKVPRIFNTYGPRMDPEDGRVVSNFIVQALRGQDLTIYGDGTQTRSFCFVDDLVEGFVRFMATSADVTGPINLGNTGEFTVGELAEKVLAKVGGSSRIVYRELPSDDPKVRQPDITKARELLGWQPKVSLDEGLDRTIAYFTKVVSP